MAITAMCFNVVHDEIVIILKHRHNESPRLLKETSVSSKPGCASNNLDSENSVVNNTLEYPVAVSYTHLDVYKRQIGKFPFPKSYRSKLL